MICPKCGKDNLNGSKFCNDCGERLPEQTETRERVPLPPSIFKDVPEPEPIEIKKPESKLKLFLKKIEEKQTLSLVIGIIICVIFLMIIVAVFSTCNSSATIDSSRVNAYSSASKSSSSESSSSQTASNSNFNSIEPIVISDLDETVKFHDISLKVSKKWEHKVINENNECYYIDGTSFFISLQRKEISQEASNAFAELVLENSDGEYTSVRKDNVNGVDGVAFTSSVDDEHIARASAFYVNNSSYFVSLVCKKEYEEEMMLSFPLIRASVTFKVNKPKTEPETEKPTPEPTEALKPTKPIIDNPTSTGGWGAHGTGDYVAEGLNVEDYAVLTINYYGDGNFSVVSYENGDDYDDLLVNEIGNYSGRVLIDHGGKFDLEINADGEWTIETSGLSVDDSTSFSGTGDCITGITTHSGGNWEITNDGDSNFAVIQYGVKSGYMDLMVNEIGYYQGTVKSEKAQNDNIFFEVNSDGNWTIKRK